MFFLSRLHCHSLRALLSKEKKKKKKQNIKQFLLKNKQKKQIKIPGQLKINLK